MRRLLLLLFLVVGCKTASDPAVGSCEPFVGEYPIEYVGGALGRGSLRLSLPRDGARTDVLEGRLMLMDDSGTRARIELYGPATCDHDLVHLTFGAGDHPEARVRVLGGTGTIVPALGRVQEMFGIWEVNAVVKADGHERRLFGFLKESKPEQGES
ncbi:MAG: hypothetical protein AAF449_08725 [Myxococcota bacterium]